jgi:hypothetical protein
MQNFGNGEKIKERLVNDMDNIIDEKRVLFDQIKQVEV